MKFPLTCLLVLAASPVGWTADFEKDIKPVLKQYCVDCHNADKKKGDFDITPMLAKPDFAETHDEWEKLAELMLNREMPPEKKPQPAETDRTKIIEWIENQLHSLAANEPPNPGRVTLRRLNKDEYRRTVRELLSVDFSPVDFPEDEMGYGFNNIGDVLSLSPLLMEKYLAAAEEISRKVISADPPKAPKRKMRGDQFGPTSESVQPLENHTLGLYREAEVRTSFDFIRAGDYTLRVRAYGDLAGPEAPKLALKLGDQPLATFDVNTDKPKTFEAKIKAPAGRQQLIAAFLNNYRDTTNEDPKLRGDRNLYIESVEIEGPLDGKPEPKVTSLVGAKWQLSQGVEKSGDNHFGFSSNGEAKLDYWFGANDDYIIRVRVHGDQAGPELPKLRVQVGDQPETIFGIKAKAGQEDVRDVRVTLPKKMHTITVGFTNDFYDPAKNADRNLNIHSVEIVGPINNPESNLPQGQRELNPPPPAPGQELTVARQILGGFAKRAYRRNVSPEEVEKLVKFVDLSLKNGGSFLEGLQAAVQASLCSPNFLFRWELDSSAVKPGDVRNLGDFEIASRLSYFLWSSMPDAELFALADKGELLKNGNLEKQVVRMLKDYRARALVENFGSQWLQLHNVYDIDPDPKKFPKFSYELREDMRRETQEFLNAVMKDDLSILDLVDARFTYVNERLARHYGIEGVKGNEFRRVELAPDSPRGGVLTMASVLLATSQPTRTSPVIRGKWILEQILGTPPPPPPPNVPPLEAKHIDPNLPLKKKLEMHRESADCAGCHAKIDPIGFALENFDAIGAYRTMDGPNPVDASGKLPNGTEFHNANDLKKMIRGDKFVHNVAEKMMIYGLGRGLERYDKAALAKVVATSKESEYHFSSLVLAIVKSDPFLKRKTGEKRVAAN